MTGIDVRGGSVVGVETTGGYIRTGTVLNATAGWGSTIADMAGVRLPLTTFPLQACVTEPLKPFLDVVIVSGSLHVYVSQSDRGELVMGASVDPYTSYSMDSSLAFMESIAGHMLELFPFLSKVRVLRQWAGLCDMTPDYSPIMGFTPVQRLSCGRGLGHVRLQGVPDLRADNGGIDRRRPYAGADSPVSGCPGSRNSTWLAKKARRRWVTDRRIAEKAGCFAGLALAWALNLSAPMLILSCPNCGERNVSEFRFGGEYNPRPADP